MGLLEETEAGGRAVGGPADVQVQCHTLVDSRGPGAGWPGPGGPT